MADRHFVIGVNAYEANVASRVGSNVYAYELLRALEKLTRDMLSISIEVFLPSAPLADMPVARERFSYHIHPPKKLWTLWRLPLALFMHRRHDIFLNLGHYAPRFCPSPQAVCVMDLAYEKFPQFFLPKDLYQLKNWTRRSVQVARHVFTISSSAKQDIVDLYGKAPEDITVAYPGVDLGSIPDIAELERKKTPILQKFDLSETEYILLLGTVQPRKNVFSALRAFEKIQEKSNHRYTLVVAGKMGWMTQDVLDAIEHSPQKEHIRVTGFVSQEEKWVLLRNASVSVLVGYYEGFGIPAIESMGLGVRAVVSNTASLPEVVGSYGVRVDPYSVDDIAKGIQEVLLHPVSAQERGAMMEWARHFRWEESARIVLSTLQSLV